MTCRYLEQMTEKRIGGRTFYRCGYDNKFRANATCKTGNQCEHYEPQPDLYESNKWLVDSKQDLDKIKLSWKVIKKVIEKVRNNKYIDYDELNDELLKRVERKAGKE